MYLVPHGNILGLLFLVGQNVHDRRKVHSQVRYESSTCSWENKEMRGDLNTWMRSTEAGCSCFLPKKSGDLTFCILSILIVYSNFIK